MKTNQNPKSSTQLVAQCIIWIGAIIATTIVLVTSQDHWIILPILISCSTTSLAILAYQPKAASGNSESMAPEPEAHNP